MRILVANQESQKGSIKK